MSEHGGVAVVAGACPPTRGRLLRRLGLLALAVFVVVMHHVVGAHAHGGAHGDAAAGMPSHAPATMSAAAHPTPPDPSRAPVLAPSPVPVAHAASATSGTLPAVAESGSPDRTGGITAMLHLCLAVLAAVVALAALLLVAVTPGASATSTGAPVRWSARSPRPPPARLRQARLQVLRL